MQELCFAAIPRVFTESWREKSQGILGLQYLRPRLVKGGVSFWEHESNCLGPKFELTWWFLCHQGHAGICQQYSQFCPFQELNNERDADRINLAVVNVDAEMFYSLEDGMLVVWPTWWLLNILNPAGGRWPTLIIMIIDDYSIIQISWNHLAVGLSNLSRISFCEVSSGACATGRASTAVKLMWFLGHAQANGFTWRNITSEASK